MLKKITIDNFRTHHKTVLELSGGINVIIGLPDSGKTNIIRSILWLLTNRPLGFRFHSDISLEPNTMVRIDFQDGSWVELNKNNKGACYYKTSLDKEPLKAVGQNVPDSVTAIANMSELNIQKQLDRHFLICSSPVEVAKVFNRITRLEKIDKTVSLLTTDINSCNKEIRRTNDGIAEIQTALNQIGDLSSMELDSENIVNLQMQYNDLILGQSTLQSKVDFITSSLASMEKYANIQKAMAEFTMMADLQNNIDIFVEECEERESTIQSIQIAEKQYKKYQQCQEMSADYESLMQCKDEVEYEEDILKELQKALENLDKHCLAMQEAGNKLKEELKSYKVFLNTIKICPFCDKCTTPLEEHDFNLFLKGFEI